MEHWPADPTAYLGPSAEGRRRKQHRTAHGANGEGPGDPPGKEGGHGEGHWVSPRTSVPLIKIRSWDI